MLAYIHPGEVRHEFMESILKLLTAEKSYQLGLINAQSGPLISRARNMLAEQFVEKPDFTHMLFVDSDIQFEPEDVEALLKADKPIVGGVYFGMDQNQQLFPTGLVKQDGSYKPIPLDKVPLHGCKKVDAVGMGLTLITRQVMEALQPDQLLLWPFAETVINGRGVGEDVSFCLRAREKGYQTWVCGDARAGHAKTAIVGG